MRALLSVVLATMLTGCCEKSLQLDPKWKPLDHVCQASDKLIKPGITTTIGTACYCGDLNEWLRTYPAGSVDQEALLLHEREHAVRQAAFPGGVDAWIAAYLADTSFRWREEQAGWKLEITRLVKDGRGLNEADIARRLNDDYDIGINGRMVSYADALAFVQATIAEARR